MIWYFSALSCGLPAFIGYFNRKKFSKNFYPFVYILILAFFTEFLAISSEVLDIPIIKSNAYNIYIFVSFSLFLYFFTLNKVFSRSLAIILFLIISLAKIIELLFMPKGDILMYTTILDSAIIIIGFLKIISNEVFFSKDKLHHNFLFLVAFSTIVLSLFDIFNSIIGYIVTLPYSLKYNISIIYKTVNGLYYLVLTYAFYRLIWKKKLSQ